MQQQVRYKIIRWTRWVMACAIGSTCNGSFTCTFCATHNAPHALGCILEPLWESTEHTYHFIRIANNDDAITDAIKVMLSADVTAATKTDRILNNIVVFNNIFTRTHFSSIDIGNGIDIDVELVDS